jgi:glucose-6-phosphate 1-dehydrogenase
MMAEPSQTDSNPLRQALPRAQAPQPCAIVLFGATGDLAHRKLVPALYRLYHGGNLPTECAIVGYGRRDWSDDDLREEYKKSFPDSEKGSDFEQIWPQFASRLVFAAGTFDDPESFQALKAKLEELDQTHGTRGNRVFYLAVAPEFFQTIIDQLGEAGLIHDWRQETPWSRVVIEKPFGHDLESARELSRDVSRVLDETQVYRIDHYLGKETVQNILALRFGNSIFEPLWNRRHVASIQITVAEEVGMPGNRGSYYDSAGAIRDMVQNHMLQLLCLVAMEAPVDLSADAVRSEKVKVLQALPRWEPEDVYQHVVRAQYTAGSIEGEDVPGYRQEKGVATDSTTSPYLAIRLTLNNWRWAGVPIFLRTGKRLPKRATEIAIQFKRPPTQLFDVEHDGHQTGNQLVLRIQPNEGASLTFEAKIPGSRRRLQEVRMDFRYGTAFASPPPEAYERLLLDVMLGDPTLFTRTDEVENAWRFISSILDAWDRPDAPTPAEYPAGSWGPQAADELIRRDDARWRRL